MGTLGRSTILVSLGESLVRVVVSGSRSLSEVPGVYDLWSLSETPGAPGSGLVRDKSVSVSPQPNVI